MLSAPTRVVFAAFMFVLPVACVSGGESDAGTGDGDGDGDGNDDAGVTDAGIDFTPDPACNKGTWVVTLDGQLSFVDETAVDAAFIQVCVRVVGGIFVCLPPVESGGDGSYARVVPENARCFGEATTRVLHTASKSPTVYCALELDIDDARMHVPDLTLFPTATPAARPPLGTVSEARPVVLSSSLTLSVVPELLLSVDADPDVYDKITAVEVAGDAPGFCGPREIVDDTGAIVPFDDVLDRVFGFFPESDISGRFDVTIANSDALAPGTVVELLALGGLATTMDFDTIQEGKWVVFGTGTVSADGTVIEATGTSGIPTLTWMGVRYP